MRVSLLLLAAMLTFSTAQAETVKALFIGNSYTWYNDLPGMTEQLALSMGDTLIWESSTPSGYSLQEHAGLSATTDLIQQGGWDFVILQEQSQMPSFPDEQLETGFFASVEYLVDLIRDYNTCAIPLLYMTWGREEGDSQNCEDWPPVCTYEGMQDLLSQNYHAACDLTTSWCSPVGMVWKDIHTTTDIDVFDPDGSHPNEAGTYLAASTFYVAMFGNNPITGSYDGGLDLVDSQDIRSAAWSLWQNQPSAYRQHDLLAADLAFTEVDFGWQIDVSTSSYVDSIVVNTGDDVFVWEDGDINQLFINETTYFEITAYSSCTESIVLLDSLIIGQQQSIEQLLQQSIGVFPNPASAQVQVNLSAANGQVWLLDARGKAVRTRNVQSQEFEMDVADLPQGIYTLVWRSNGATLQRRIVIAR